MRSLLAGSLVLLLCACGTRPDAQGSPATSGTSSTGTPMMTAAIETPPSAASTLPRPVWAKLAINGDVFTGTLGSSTPNAAIAMGPGYVAVGSDSDHPMAWTSSDGRTWTRSEPPPYPKGGAEVRMADVIAGGPGLVAVGSEMGDNPCIGSTPIDLAAYAAGPVRAVAWTSTDGQRWTRAPDSASFAKVALTHLARVGSTVVAIGPTSCTSRTRTWTSTDGIHWQAHSVPAFDDAQVNDAVSDGSRLVAVGWSGCGKGVCVSQAWISADGIVWNSAGRVGLGPNGVTSVAAGAHGFVAVGGDDSGVGAVWTSTDGATWLRATPLGIGPLGVVEAVGSGYVAAGGARIWDSPDGVTWRLRLDQTSPSTPPTFTVIVRGPSETLAIGTVDGVTVWMGPAEIAP